MVASSSSCHRSFLLDNFEKQHEKVIRTVEEVRHLRQLLPRSSPLFCLIRLLVEKCIGNDTLPIHGRDIKEIPPLTSHSRNELWNRLVTPISIGEGCVTPYQWIAKIFYLSCQQDWSVSEIFFTGSESPLTRDYWKLLLQNVFPKLQEDSISLFSKAFKGCSPKWRNLDSLVCIRIGSAPDAIDNIEKTVLQALKDICPVRTNVRIRTPKRINDNQGTIFTIGDRERSFDLTLWYNVEKNPLPEFFTQKGIAVPIHEVLGIERNSWPSLTPRLFGVTPEMLLVDKAMNAVRYRSVAVVGSDQNFGIFKKLIVMKSKGGLGLQTGLEKWAIGVYLFCFPGGASASYQAQQSYFEHLPHSWGAFLAHRLHWFNALREQGYAEEAQTLFTDLQPPPYEDAPEWVKKSLFILKYMPHYAPLVVQWWDFMLHLSFLADPGTRVTLGIWEGDFTLCLSLDDSGSSVYQAPLRPLELFSNAIALRDQMSQLEVKMRGSGDLISSFFSYFKLDGHLTPHQRAMKFLAHHGLREELFRECIQVFFPTLVEPQSLNVTSSSIPVTVLSPIHGLLQGRKWIALMKLLLNNTSNNDDLEPVEALWELLKAWLRKSNTTPISRIDVEVLMKLIDRYVFSLRRTMNEKKHYLLVDLVFQNLNKKQQLEFLLQHEENRYRLLNVDLVERHMKSHLRDCLDCVQLLRFYRLYPDEVDAHVKEKILSQPVLPHETLQELVTYLKWRGKKYFAEIEFSLLKQLVLANRISERIEYEISLDPTPLLRENYERFKNENQLDRARAVLSDWEVISNSSFEEEKLSLLEMEVGKNTTPSLAREVVKLWQSSKKPSIAFSERITALAVEILTWRMTTDSTTMQMLWSLFKLHHFSIFKEIPIAEWKQLLTNLHRSQSQPALWEALFLSLQRNPPYWNRETENLFKSHLSWRLKQKWRKGEEDPHMEQILHAVYLLDKMLDWKDHFKENESLTALSMKAVSSIVRDAPKMEIKLVAWQLGGYLIRCIQGGDLSYDQWKYAISLKNEFRESGLPHGLEMIETPRKDPVATFRRVARLMNLLVVLSAAMAIWHYVFAQNAAEGDGDYIF